MRFDLLKSYADNSFAAEGILSAALVKFTPANGMVTIKCGCEYVDDVYHNNIMPRVRSSEILEPRTQLFEINSIYTSCIS